MYAPSGAAGLNELLAEASEVPVEVVPMRFSYKQRQALVQRIADDAASWELAGAEINSIVPESGTDMVEIGLEVVTATTEAALLARYGGDRVRVVQSQQRSVTTGRFDDTSTYKSGGIQIVGQSNNKPCTAGLGVHTNSLPASTSAMMLTAGHCYAHGERINHNGLYVGSVVRSAEYYKDGGFDISYVNMKAAYRNWETDTLLARNDGSMVSVPEGVTVCHSGIATNKKCGTTVGAGGECHTPDDLPMEICHIQRVWDDQIIVAGGDSGGPAFVASPYTTATTRYMSAVGITTMGFRTGRCTTDRGFVNDKCAYEMGFTELPAIFNATTWFPNY